MVNFVPDVGTKDALKYSPWFISNFATIKSIKSINSQAVGWDPWPIGSKIDFLGRPYFWISCLIFRYYPGIHFYTHFWLICDSKRRILEDDSKIRFLDNLHRKNNFWPHKIKSCFGKYKEKRYENKSLYFVFSGGESCPGCWYQIRNKIIFLRLDRKYFYTCKIT